MHCKLHWKEKANENNCGRRECFEEHLQYMSGFKEAQFNISQFALYKSIVAQGTIHDSPDRSRTRRIAYAHTVLRTYVSARVLYIISFIEFILCGGFFFSTTRPMLNPRKREREQFQKRKKEVGWRKREGKHWLNRRKWSFIAFVTKCLSKKLKM